MDVGATLRRARERKRLTLEQIAQSTKISVSTLNALESNDFDRLPATVYTRGFLRSFAREVDLDPEEMVEHYMEQCDAAMPAPMTAAPVEAPLSAESQRTAAPRQRTIVVPRFGVALAVLALLIAGGAYYGMVRYNADAASAASAAEAPPVAAPAPTPPPDAIPAANVVPDVLRIELTATGPCWVSAHADGEGALSRLLQAGEKHSLQANDEVILRVGDPSTVSISINGVAGRPLGRPGQPITVQINKQNFRDFQQL